MDNYTPNTLKSPTVFKGSKAKRDFIKKVKTTPKEKLRQAYIVDIRFFKEEMLKNTNRQQMIVHADSKEEAYDFALWQWAQYWADCQHINEWNKTTTWFNTTHCNLPK